MANQIRKYELSGVSLRRINDVTHNISSLGLEQDSYHVEIDRTSANDSVARNTDSATVPELSFSSDEFVGGKDVLSSENILFNAVIPSYDIITPTGGNESSFTGNVA